MNRQKMASILLVFALAGVTLTACTTQQRSRTSSNTPAMVTGVEGQPEMAATAPAPVRAGAWPSRQSTATTEWVHFADPTGDPRTSALGVEVGRPRELRANQPMEAELIITNLTDQEVNNVMVLHKHSGNLQWTSVTPEGKAENGAYAWFFDSIGPRQVKTIKATGMSPSEGVVNGCTTVTYDIGVCSSTRVTQPKLRLVKTGPAEVMACDDIVYQFEVTNTGTGTLSNIKVTDPLPAGLATPDGQRTVEMMVNSLAAGQSRQLTTRVRAARAGRYENKATASAEGVTAESGMVATVVRQPVLTITKKCMNATTYVGRPLNYQITVTNTGDGAANEAVIEDVIPSGAAFTSASDGGRAVGGKATWNLGTLAPKASKTVELTLQPNAVGTYRNTASVRAACADMVTDACETNVTGIPAILLEVIDLEDPDEVGTDETYVITVTNQGSAPDTNITVAVTLEPNQVFVSSTGTTPAQGSGQNILLTAVKTLGAKQIAQWRVVVKNLKPGDVRFKAVMNSDQLTRPVEETEATRIYE